jgi:hypothetical protein
MDKKAKRRQEFEQLLFSRGVGGFELPDLAKEIGGDTVGRLGMCVHCQNGTKTNAHGVTPI